MDHSKALGQEMLESAGLDRTAAATVACSTWRERRENRTTGGRVRPPSLARLCRNFAALHHNFTVTSRQLHANFTPTSHELHATSHTRQNFGRAEMIIIWTARVGTRAKLVRKFCKRVSSFIADATDATENFLRFLHGFRLANFKELHGHFTVTSPWLRAHFTTTSRALHANFTNFTPLQHY